MSDATAAPSIRLQWKRIVQGKPQRGRVSPVPEDEIARWMRNGIADVRAAEAAPTVDAAYAILSKAYIGDQGNSGLDWVGTKVE
jgi:hypothetical protein